MKFEGKPRVELLEREQRAPGSALSLNASAGVGGKQNQVAKPHMLLRPCSPQPCTVRLAHTYPSAQHGQNEAASAALPQVDVPEHNYIKYKIA